MATPSRFNVSSQLLRSTWQVVQKNPKLLLFPMLNVVVLTPPGPSVITAYQSDSALAAWSLIFLYWVLYYLAISLISTFVNVAFYHETFRALSGDLVSFRGGLRFARQRLRSIIRWVVFACSVGIILELLRLGMGWKSRAVILITILAWDVVSVFVISILIRDENIGPMALLRASERALKETRGEPIIGLVKFQVFGICLIFGICVMLGVTLALLLPPATTPEKYVMPLIAALTLPLAFAWYVGTSIYYCALYVYASEGVVPDPFTLELMNTAWKVKKQ